MLVTIRLVRCVVERQDVLCLIWVCRWARAGSLRSHLAAAIPLLFYLIRRKCLADGLVQYRDDSCRARYALSVVLVLLIPLLARLRLPACTKRVKQKEGGHIDKYG